MKIEAGSEALQQIAQSQEGLVDHVDIVDDGACTGEEMCIRDSSYHALPVAGSFSFSSVKFRVRPALTTA